MNLLESKRAAVLVDSSGHWMQLATGIGKTFDYTISTGMLGKAVVAMAYVNSPSSEIALWVKISDNVALGVRI